MDDAINLEALNSEILQWSLADIAGTTDRETVITKAINYMQEKATAGALEIPPIQTRQVTGKLRIFAKEIVVESIGKPITNKLGQAAVCSFLGGRNPKIYILPYVFFAQGCGMNLTIWIDDVFAKFRYVRTNDEQLQINDEYRRVLKPWCSQVIFSSEYFTHRVIPSRLVAKIKSISWEKFVNVLPYDARKPKLAKVIDLIHLLWQTVVVSQCDQEYYLTAINTKSQFVIINSLCGARRNFTFLQRFVTPLANQNVYLFGKDDKLFDKMSDEEVDYFFRYYSFAHPLDDRTPVLDMRTHLNRFLHSQLLET